MKRFVLFSVLCITAAAAFRGGSAPAVAADAPGGKVQFNRDIRPFLSDTCFKCHGPDKAARKADLRLDTRDDAVAKRKGGAPIVPGNAAKSAAYLRVVSSDPDELMPPPDSHLTLTPEQKELFKKWIEQGAEYQPHWAFVAPKRHTPPVVKKKDWVKNPIDAFVLAELEARKLSPSPEADRRALIRRVSFDITGLPPTVEEVEAFVADKSPRAYESLVDRLLKSPRYGEHMARAWLDGARYADTHGYQYDQERTQWAWRDWVIDSYNANMPFDRFTVEQLAGDLLPGATDDQKLATGFNRNHPITIEGGVIEEEYRTEYVMDRVGVTSTVWLGLTMGCARCHDHKYDPISMKDFYSFFAFFNQVPEGGISAFPPQLKLPTRSQKTRMEELAGKMKTLEAELARPRPEAVAALAKWEKDFVPAWTVLDPLEFTSGGGATLTKLDDQSVLASGTNPDRETYTVKLHTKQAGLTGLRLEALTHPSLPSNGPGRHPNSNFVLSTIQIEAAPVSEASKKQAVPIARATADYSQAGHEIAKAIDADAASGWAVDGPTKKENRVAFFAFAQPVGFPGGTELRVTMKFEAPFSTHAIGRFRLAVTASAKPESSDGPPPNIAAIRAVEKARRTDAQRAELKNWFLLNAYKPTAELASKLAALRAEQAAVQNDSPATMVMQDMPTPRDTFMLVRGQYDKHGDKVPPATPVSLPPMPAGAPMNRLGMAQWLVAPNHPLTSRVAVNRLWQQCFGVGLVKTAEDFGLQGESPSHPELLDWLAMEFVSNGWDVKRMLKTIVTSATYRQSSRVTPDLVSRDPENRLLARGPRIRLQAETIRDNALAVGGLLVEKIGGPSVYPYQPPGLWKELNDRDGLSSEYKVQTGESLYRRSMYTFWKRTVPPPAMQVFDAPEREFCVVRRSTTNTPLQALVLLNDPQFVEAARKLGERMMTRGGAATDARIAYGFTSVTARAPTAQELAVLRRAYEQHLAEFRKSPDAAKKLLAVGESKPDPKLDPAELAAWATLGRLLLNLDETITKN